LFYFLATSELLMKKSQKKSFEASGVTNISFLIALLSNAQISNSQNFCSTKILGWLTGFPSPKHSG